MGNTEDADGRKQRGGGEEKQHVTDKEGIMEGGGQKQHLRGDGEEKQWVRE